MLDSFIPFRPIHFSFFCSFGKEKKLRPLPIYNPAASIAITLRFRDNEVVAKSNRSSHQDCGTFAVSKVTAHVPSSLKSLLLNFATVQGARSFLNTKLACRTTLEWAGWTRQGFNSAAALQQCLCYHLGRHDEGDNCAVSFCSFLVSINFDSLLSLRSRWYVA